jgi:hypothetical protein
MINCFENIIGVIGCKGAESTSGLYLNGTEGIEGISIKTASLSADSETITGHDLLKGCIKKASTEIILQASEKLSRYFQFNTILDSYTYLNNGVATTNPPALLFPFDSYNLYSCYYIDTLVFKSSDSQTAVLTINGVNQNLTLVANTDYVLQVNKEYYDSLTIQITGTNIYTNTSFFNGIIQKRCSEDKFWCMYKKELAMPIKYLAGSMFFAEVINSDRYNLVTFTNKELASDNYTRCDAMAKKYLTSAIEKIKNSIPNSCGCLKCTDINYSYAKP